MDIPYKQVLLDIWTRWSSSKLMLGHLLKMKDPLNVLLQYDKDVHVLLKPMGGKSGEPLLLSERDWDIICMYS